MQRCQQSGAGKEALWHRARRRHPPDLSSSTFGEDAGINYCRFLLDGPSPAKNVFVVHVWRRTLLATRTVHVQPYVHGAATTAQRIGTDTKTLLTCQNLDYAAHSFCRFPSTSPQQNNLTKYSVCLPLDPLPNKVCRHDNRP